MFRALRLRAKLLLLALVPICLLTLLICSIFVVLLQKLADEQEAHTRSDLMADRRPGTEI